MSCFKNEDKMPRFLIWLVFVSKVGWFLLTYGSICVVQHALICDKCWWFERFKTFRAKIEQCNFSIGQ
ncbi:MAG: hypothetical protein M0P12_04995, partial [Paludibacteraceae bacterium]|nr:hypothetical protein [Paludibacteraceae bacterium]